MNKSMFIFFMCALAFGNQLQNKENNLPEVINLNPKNDPMMRWADDRIIYAGDVAYNAWAMLLDIDDEAISVDYYRGDTLRAAVACADSVIRIFRSNDNGKHWNYEHAFGSPGWAAYEPEIIHGQDGQYYHIFCRISSGNGDILYARYDSTDTFYSRWIENAADTMLNYSACSDRVDHYDDYYLYCAYHRALGGLSEDMIWLSRSTDRGMTWTTDSLFQVGGDGFPDLAYGSDGYLYECHLGRFINNYYSIFVDRSPNRGESWFSAQVIEGDTSIKQGPQIAAAHDGSGDVWVVFPKRNIATYYQYALRSLWSQDSGATWSFGSWVNSFVNFQHVLPSISVFDAFNSTEHDPYVSFIRSDTSWINPVVYTFWWQGSTWSDAYTFNDSVPALTRPIQTWAESDVPAIAYVGEDGKNVYFDFSSNFSIEEEKISGINKNMIIDIFPNPFTKTTRIAYSLPKNSRVLIKVYNVLGQEIVTLTDGVKNSGTHILDWDRTNSLPKGIYFLKIETNSDRATKKLIIE